MPTSNQSAVVTARYEERDGRFDLQTFAISGAKVRPTNHPAKLSGPMEDRPEWLVNIVNLGKVGGWSMSPPEPPPDFILWFDLDEHGELVEFSVFTD